MCNGSDSSEDFVTCVEEKTFGLKDVLGDIQWNGKGLGLKATFGIFNGENQHDIKNLTDSSHWLSEVSLIIKILYHPDQKINDDTNPDDCASYGNLPHSQLHYKGD